MEKPDKMTGFVGFKTSQAEGARYRDAARAKGVPLSVMVRTAVDSLLTGDATAIARTKEEALLLGAVKLDAPLAADLTAIGAGARDRDARELVRRLAVLLSSGRVGSPRRKGRKR